MNRINLILLIVISLCIFGCNQKKEKCRSYLSESKNLAENLNSAIDNALKQDSLVDLSSVFQFEWDEVIIPKSYTDLTEIYWFYKRDGICKV